MNGENRASYTTMLWRAWRLRCPRCGEGWLFKNWISMYPMCPWCELKYERAPGYFLGSIYINYGVTALLVTASYFALFFSGIVSPEAAVWIVAAFAVLFPICFFRYAPACGWASTTIGIRPPKSRPFSTGPGTTSARRVDRRRKLLTGAIRVGHPWLSDGLLATIIYSSASVSRWASSAKRRFSRLTAR